MGYNDLLRLRQADQRGQDLIQTAAPVPIGVLEQLIN